MGLLDGRKRSCVPPHLTSILSPLSGSPFGAALFSVPVGTRVVGADLDTPTNARDKL